MNIWLLPTFLTLLVLIAVSDIRYRTIPHHLLGIAAVVALLRLYDRLVLEVLPADVQAVYPDSSSAYIVIFGLLGISAVYLVMTGSEAIGMGDIKLLTVLWLWHFPNLSIYLLHIVISFLALYVWSRVLHATEHPFAPFILFSTTILL